jgi:hypothetical protein
MEKSIAKRKENNSPKLGEGAAIHKDTTNQRS